MALDAAARAALNGRSLVLVGMMGSGKSSIGVRLARALDLPFVDADTAVEQAAGMPVAEIFARLGEAAFRDGERRVIARLLDGPQCVLATGGGAFIDADTRALILDRAVAVWLDADIDTLVERTSRRSTRPLLVGKDARTVLTELDRVRRPIYALAPIRVPSAAHAHEVTVRHIKAALAAGQEQDSA